MNHTTGSENPLNLTPDELAELLAHIGMAESLTSDKFKTNAEFDAATTERTWLNKAKQNIETRRVQANQPFLAETRRINALAEVLFDLIKPAIQSLDAKRKDFEKRANGPVQIENAHVTGPSLQDVLDAGLPADLRTATAPVDPVSVKKRIVKEVEIVDGTKLPAKYFVIDMAKVKADLMNGTPVPGARLIDKEILL